MIFKLNTCIVKDKIDLNEFALVHFWFKYFFEACLNLLIPTGKNC